MDSQWDLRLLALGPVHCEALWQPSVDVYRCADGWVLKFELAGVREEDIQVQLDSRGITVIGTRLDRMPYNVQEPHVIEIAYSRFERFVALSERFENIQFKTLFQDGMLYVHVLRGEDKGL